MINSNKDFLFTIICMLWFFCGVISNYYFDIYGICLNNLFWIIFMLILVILKNKYIKFEEWLNKKF